MYISGSSRSRENPTFDYYPSATYLLIHSEYSVVLGYRLSSTKGPKSPYIFLHSNIGSKPSFILASKLMQWKSPFPLQTQKTCASKSPLATPTGETNQNGSSREELLKSALSLCDSILVRLDQMGKTFGKPDKTASKMEEKQERSSPKPSEPEPRTSAENLVTCTDGCAEGAEVCISDKNPGEVYLGCLNPSSSTGNTRIALCNPLNGCGVPTSEVQLDSHSGHQEVPPLEPLLPVMCKPPLDWDVLELVHIMPARIFSSMRSRATCPMQLWLLPQLDAIESNGGTQTEFPIRLLMVLVLVPYWAMPRMSHTAERQAGCFRSTASQRPPSRKMGELMLSSQVIRSLVLSLVWFPVVPEGNTTGAVAD